MALDFPRVLVEASAVEDVSNQVANLYATLQQLLTHNSNQAIDWGAGSTPAYITEDAKGNINGKQYSRQDVSNAIGSLDAIRSLIAANGGAHLGNLNHLTRPTG